MKKLSLIIFITVLLALGITACLKCVDVEEASEQQQQPLEPKAYINSADPVQSTIEPGESTDIIVGVLNPDNLELSLEAIVNRGTISPQLTNVVGNETVFRYKAEDTFFKEPGTYTISAGFSLFFMKIKIDTYSVKLYVIVAKDDSGKITWQLTRAE